MPGLLRGRSHSRRRRNGHRGQQSRVPPAGQSVGAPARNLQYAERQYARPEWTAPRPTTSPRKS